MPRDSLKGISRVDGRGLTTKDILEKRILMGRLPLPSDGQGIDVSEAARGNGILFKTFITPAVERLLADVPERYFGAMNFESRLGDVLYHACGLLSAEADCEKKDIKNPALIRRADKSLLLGMSLKMPFTVSKGGRWTVEERAFFLVELRQLPEYPSLLPEPYQVTIGLDMRYHA